MSLRVASELEEVGFIQTGTFIDKFMGGIPRGVITEIFGDEGVGKSSLCLQMVASAQKQGIRCLWVDVEYSYAPRYATSLGVDNSKLAVIRSRYAEDVIDQLVESIDDGKFGLIIVDSIGGITSRTEVEKNADAKTIGIQASLVSRFCRKIVPPLSETGSALVAINHSVVDIMSGRIMSSGGKKLAYHKAFSVRLRNKTGVSIKQGDRKIGRVVIAECKKNKIFGTEGMEIEGNMIFGQAFSASADLLQSAIDNGVLTKRGQSFFLGEINLGRGINTVRKTIEGDAELQQTIHEKIKAIA